MRKAVRGLELDHTAAAGSVLDQAAAREQHFTESPMPTKLTIRWDGTAPGLQEHALSLSAWLAPLSTLLRAVRRAASNLDKSHADDPERGKKGGRLTPAAHAIDLRITAVRDGCVNLDLEAVQALSGSNIDHSARMARVRAHCFRRISERSLPDGRSR